MALNLDAHATLNHRDRKKVSIDKSSLVNQSTSPYNLTCKFSSKCNFKKKAELIQANVQCIP